MTQEYTYKEKVRNRNAWYDDTYKYRFDPVPGVHRSSYYGHIYRYPKTLNEFKSSIIIDHNEFLDLTSAQVAKFRRQRRFLPTAYDDLRKSNWKNTSWKRFRKHQFLNKPSFGEV